MESQSPAFTAAGGHCELTSAAPGELQRQESPRCFSTSGSKSGGLVSSDSIAPFSQNGEINLVYTLDGSNAASVHYPKSSSVD